MQIIQEEYQEIRDILRDYHGGMTTMEVSKKYGLKRGDVMQLLELEVTGRFNDTVFA